ncbi:hypothetical protein RR48_10854 [Papilio machaon]|uniref:Uncharacterized protein n=1 Tax=Papilio machaon TaxID=76193 RepID=A0A194R8U3_PAPMA|nr:hypothetical protein RR48_10854 [Papilio machaon]
MSTLPRNADSLETILHFQNRDVQSQWSVVWSTAHIPGMDNAAGGAARRPALGRRRLRVGALTLGACLAMHCRIAAAALTGGFFVFMFFLILAVALLANPLRHFEVYLGQWSISGPGRAFRIIPMLDGIGMAICINAILRAIICCTVAAIAAKYVVHAASDDRLPYTYCRDFELHPYEPVLRNRRVMQYKVRPEPEFSTVGFHERAWRNFSYRSIEVLSWKPDYSYEQLNTPLVPYIIFCWVALWLLMVMEHFTFKRVITDALECALYIHSASTGTELIHGKGLNHYASGHIDARLNSENVWHSSLLLVLTGLHTGAAALCAFDDCYHPNAQVSNMASILFGGLMFSYMTVAFVLLKTALHTIFEYKGGLGLLESVDMVMSEVSTAYVCLLELAGLLYVYRGQDFISDVNVATEDNACSTRIGTQWQIIPIITLIVIILKLTQLKHSEMPRRALYAALAPLAAVVLAVPLRACYNACVFVRLTLQRTKTNSSNTNTK